MRKRADHAALDKLLEAEEKPPLIEYVVSADGENDYLGLSIITGICDAAPRQTIEAEAMNCPSVWPTDPLPRPFRSHAHGDINPGALDQPPKIQGPPPASSVIDGRRRLLLEREERERRAAAAHQDWLREQPQHVTLEQLRAPRQSIFNFDDPF